MKTSKKIGLNIPESEDFVDVGKLAENFEKIDKHMYMENLLRSDAYIYMDATLGSRFGETREGSDWQATRLSDGRIQLNGTPKNGIGWWVLYQCNLQAGTYTLEGCPKGGGKQTFNLSIYRDRDYIDDIAIARDCGEGCTFTLEEDMYCEILFNCKAGISLDKKMIEPMLTQGSLKHSKYIPQKLCGDSESGAPIDNILRAFKSSLLKRIQLAYWKDALVVQIGTIVIGRVKVASADGLANLSGLPSPVQTTYFTAVSTEQEKIYTKEFQAGETTFLMSVPYGSTTVITFMYETEE